MTKKHRFFVSIAVFILISLFFFILASDHGFFDYRSLKKERQRLVLENARLEQENHSLSVTIDRLKHDPAYIENIAREELGMVRENELIFKLKSPPER